MSLPTEARDGLTRAWLEVLHQRHPHVTWVPITQPKGRTNARRQIRSKRELTHA
jgi:hypothetical protein